MPGISIIAIFNCTDSLLRNGQAWNKHINAEVHITLTADEALVLFELLSRYADSDQLNIIDQAEQRALWNLCCILEKKSVAPFNLEYGQALSEARTRLRDEE